MIITAKDDSHSEDNGKVSYYRQTFKINKNILYPLFNESLIHNKWVKSTMQMEPGYIFKRIK
ncbi:hypothetical protein [Mucilaginibacter sp.]|uniref:hypothetical protein n=1 Tax=Mucilaginibacter sp. TaxID=1882438 RepID=UPI0028447489|nr:hypothetical protein [Mucilaginibacter sp.]MDR3696283.1 hypothetical protein [Mucilaginibacter sp.]